jgi:hypothetical protein
MHFVVGLKRSELRVFWGMFTGVSALAACMRCCVGPQRASAAVAYDDSAAAGQP